MKFTLSQLIGDIGQEKFFDKYWTKKELYSESSFEEHDFYGLRDFEQTLLLNQAHLSFPTVRLIKSGKVLPETRFTEVVNRQNLLGRKISLNKVKELCENGATLIISGLNNYSRPILDLCVQLSAEFQETVQINGYLTQKHSQGFQAHYDHHEIFIIQIAGEKEWNVYGTPESAPLPVSQYYDQGKPDKSQCRIYNLKPGDVFYLPRGLWHEARSVNSSSFHLTVDIKCTLRIDFLKWLIDNVAVNDKELRLNLFKNPYDTKIETMNILNNFVEQASINPDWINEFHKARLSNNVIDLPFKI